MSNSTAGIQQATSILIKACLGGLALAAVFLVISGALYLLLSSFGLARNAVLVTAVVGGPLLGLAMLIAILLLRCRTHSGPKSKPFRLDEAPPRDTT